MCYSVVWLFLQHMKAKHKSSLCIKTEPADKGILPFGGKKFVEKATFPDSRINFPLTLCLKKMSKILPPLSII